MSNSEGASLNLSSDQVKALADGRSKAKANLQERERQTRLNANLQHQQKQLQQALQSSNNNNNNNSAALNSKKRPLQVIPANSTSPTAPNTRTNPSRPALRGNNSSSGTSNALQNAVASGSGSNHFKRDDPSQPLRNMIGSYVEYDLATLKNSKGGFLLDSEVDPRELKEKHLMEEHKLKRLENARKQGMLYEPGISLEKDSNPQCVHCDSIDLDLQLRAVFSVQVCSKCKQERPDDYSLLTKTECREDYLLTDPELKDEELLPHLLRPNPYRPTYSNMMLFLRQQVEAYAFSAAKWGSPEALDQEFARREADKREKKSKKFDKKLKELRKKTTTNIWHKRMEEEHKHLFVEGEDEDGNSVQRCDECGFVVEVEVF